MAKAKDDGRVTIRTAVARGFLPAAAPKPVHHIVVADCSGSMGGDLPKVRRQLCEKLPAMLGPKDLVSLIWFSGKTEAGKIFELRSVDDARDLQKTREMIDRWLQPIGLTGFRLPLDMAGELARKTPPTHLTNLFFMTDGCDNQWTRGDILDAVKRVTPNLDAATFVEYGYYADRDLLTKMAEVARGKLVFADTFEKYEPEFHEAITTRETGKRVQIELPANAEPIDGLVYGLGEEDDSIYTFAIEQSDSKGRAVLVPESVADIYWAEKGGGVASKKGLTTPVSDEALYASVHVFMRAGQPKVVRSLLCQIGDVRLLEAFNGCFGKQKHTEVMELARACVFDEKERFVKGHNPDFTFNPDAYTIVDLLSLLQRDSDGVTILLDSSDFRYSRISRPRVDAADLLDDEQKKQIEKLSGDLAKARDPREIKRLVGELDAIRALVGDGGIHFTADKRADGYPVLDLTWNEDRANVSMLVQKTGTLDLLGRIPDELVDQIPINFPTFVYRNYALVRDGMINVETLPLRITDDDLLNQLATRLGSRLKVVERFENKKALGTHVNIALVDLRGMPVINDRMVESFPAAEGLATAQYDLECLRCKQKVLKFYRDAVVPSEPTKSLVDRYGLGGAQFLESIGVGRNGWAPVSTKQAAVKDFYLGVEMQISIAGFKSLPSVNEVNKRRAAGSKKLAGAAGRMAMEIERVEAQKKDMSEHDFASWVDAEATNTIGHVRRAIRKIAKSKYAITLGRVWFPGHAYGSADVTIPTTDGGVSCSIKLVDVEIGV